jgi:hypothetical protein
MSDVLDRADEILAEIATLLTDAEVAEAAQVLPTVDVADVAKHKYQQSGVIVLYPGPKIQYPNPGIRRVTWRLDIIVGRMRTIREQWARLDLLVEALRPLYDDARTTVVAGQFPIPDNGIPFPGYTVTFVDPDHTS